MQHPRTPVLDSPALLRYGLPEFKSHTSPAVATDFTYQLPGDFYVRLVSVYCKFVADANAASREVVLQYLDAENNVFDLAGINTTVTANNTGLYAFSAFQPEAIATVDSSALVPLHPVILAPTQKFRLHVVNVQAGDQLSLIRTNWERFYTTNQPPVDGPHAGL